MGGWRRWRRNTTAGHSAPRSRRRRIRAWREVYRQRLPGWNGSSDKLPSPRAPFDGDYRLRLRRLLQRQCEPHRSRRLETRRCRLCRCGRQRIGLRHRHVGSVGRIARLGESPADDERHRVCDVVPLLQDGQGPQFEQCLDQLRRHLALPGRLRGRDRLRQRLRLDDKRTHGHDGLHGGTDRRTTAGDHRRIGLQRQTGPFSPHGQR